MFCTIKFSIASSLLFFSLVVNGQNNNNTVGLLRLTDNVYEGYTLFAPMSQKKTFLINNNGQLLHEWESKTNLGLTVYLNKDGTLYRAGRSDLNNNIFAGGLGGGGKVERYDWDSNLTWEYTYDNEDAKHHHDFQVLPNGNVLILAWELKSNEEVIQAGRDPNTLESGELWPDHVIEVEPQGATGGNIVWEWLVWYHLVQDFDDTKENFGVVSDNPYLVDINYYKSNHADWNHINAINYDVEKDQIILSAWAFDEFWIIDHSTTTEEAKSHSGGESGKGGDLLYRWGNPLTYKKGDVQDEKLFQQHNVHRIPAGLPNEGDILLFNNGPNRLGDIFSAVNIITTPQDENGNYLINDEGVFEPADFTYTYTAPTRMDFYAAKFSSAQQLPNGNILVCKGPQGEFFEIDTNEEIVWNYINPVSPNGPLTQGDSPFGVNSVFRVIRYAPDYAAFDGKTLEPQGNLELEPVVSNLKEFSINTAIVYPNPTNYAIKIDGLEKNSSKIDLYNTQGVLVKTINNYKKGSNVLVNDLENGIYFMFANGLRLSKLIILK